MEQMEPLWQNMQNGFIWKQYCDIDPSDLCITQDKKTERKNLMMNREIEKRLQQIEKQNRQKETEDRTENEHEK